MAAQAQVGLVLRHLHGLSAETDDTITDHQLLSRFTSTRDEEAFAALVRRHGGMVLGLCRRLLGGHHDAEDVFQAAFLILARKASSLRRGESVGAWLYRVAYRLALKARASAARRRDRETQGIAMPSPDPTAELTVKELQTLLDEELQQLPEKYRVPVVLCHLEGRTQEEAARQLGWSKGTLRRRLGQGRELLRRRLLRRGLAPAVALAASLAGAAAPAAVSLELVGTTARAALGFATGQAVMAEAERAAALAEGGLRSMFLSKVRGLTALLLLTMSLAAGMTLLARQALTAPAPPRQTPAVPPSQDPGKKDEVGSVEVSGRVVDANDKPVSGARLYYDSARADLRSPLLVSRVWATSGPDGRFRFRLPRNVFQAVDVNRRLRGSVVAVGAGHGPGWSVLLQDETRRTDLTLKLAEDAALTGRLLDLQGKPLAGVTVRAVAVSSLPHRDLKKWAEAFADRRASPFLRVASLPVGAGLPPAVTTDAAGRFRLTGLGRNRLVALRFEGQDVETSDVAVVTRPGPTFRVPRSKDRRNLGSYVFYGAGFDHVLAPGRPVSGTVRDAASGKPLAGVVVETFLPASWPTLDSRNVISVTTDDQGRYRLPGLSRGETHIIRAVPARPYLGSAERVAAGGTGPARVDFQLRRAVVIRGRVTDRVTGKPVRAAVTYVAFFDNPNLKGAFRTGWGRGVEALCDENGSFELLGLPGRGLLAARAPQEVSANYVAGAGAEKIKGADSRNRLTTFPLRILPQTYHTLVEISPAKDATSFRRDIALEPGKTVSGTVVGPDGKPVEGVRIYTTWNGLVSPPPEGRPGRFTLKAINPANPQPFFLYHDGRKLGAAILPRGDEPKDYTVRLQPLGTLTGRVLDEDGRPVTGAEMFGVIEGGQLNLPALGVSISSFRVRTDRQGRFRADAILPGVKCRGALLGRRAGGGTVFQHVAVKPGELKDLGDLRIKPGS